MLTKFKYFIICLALLCFAKIEQAEATHIIGGEMSYRHLDSNVYELTFKIYRDCFNGIPQFDDPTFIYVFDGYNKYLGYIALNQKIPTGDTLPLFSPDSCRLPPNNVCVEEKIMVDTIALPYRKEGYIFAYQRCCRNGTILNIANPSYTGTTYTQQLMMDSTIAPINSSPYFKKFPPIFICNNVDLKFDHSAIDPDGDSLVYELRTPFIGADSIIPWPIPIPGYNATKFYKPPFDTVQFIPPYNVNNQLGGTKPMFIDPKTGLLTAHPIEIGQYVVGIAVREYRNGVLLGIHRRDFQFNVTDCREKPQAVLPAVIVQCRGDLSVSFLNKSKGASSYLWDFGDPSSPFNNSVEKNPTHTFPALGTYTVTLISNPTLDCSDTAVAKVKVYNNISGAAFDLQDVCKNTKVPLIDKSVLSEGIPSAWKWTINFNPNDTLIKKDTSYVFKTPGTNYVKLVVYNENGCTDSLTKPLEVFPIPEFDITGDTLLCVGASTNLILNSSEPYIYNWTPSNTLSCNTCANPIATPKASPTKYYLTSTNQYNCKITDSITVKFRPVLKPIADMKITEGRCVPATINMNGLYSNMDSVCMNFKNWLWDFGDGQTANTQNTSHTYTQAGTYDISLQFNNADKITQSITLLPVESCSKIMFIPNTFTPNKDGHNDFVYLRGLNIKKLDLRIYNRWGEEIFKTNDIKIGWDGTYKGVKMTPQVVVYVADVTYWDDTTEHKEGNISLIE